MDRQILRSAGLLRPTEANKILSGRVANTSGGSYHPAKAGIFRSCPREWCSSDGHGSSRRAG